MRSKYTLEFIVGFSEVYSAFEPLLATTVRIITIQMMIIFQDFDILFRVCTLIFQLNDFTTKKIVEN